MMGSCAGRLSRVLDSAPAIGTAQVRGNTRPITPPHPQLRRTPGSGSLVSGYSASSGPVYVRDPVGLSRAGGRVFTWVFDTARRQTLTNCRREPFHSPHHPRPCFLTELSSSHSEVQHM